MAEDSYRAAELSHFQLYLEGTTCRYCQNQMPQGIRGCFLCGKPFQGAATPLTSVQSPTTATSSPPANTKKKVVIITIIAAILLLLCATVAGHFLGFYSLPFLPERAEEEVEEVVEDEPPVMSDLGTDGPLPPETPSIPNEHHAYFENQDINDAQLADMLASGEIPEYTTHLFLNGNHISDLSLLQGLKRLEVLYLEDNWIQDVSPLSELWTLVDLRLSDNHITDINPLVWLDRLERLHLTNNSINYLESLRELPNLRHLWLGRNDISDISPLEGLVNLEILSFGGNFVHDITALSNMTELRSLHFHDNQVSDLSPLRRLTNLVNIGLGANFVSDLSPLVGLVDLTHLYLHFNQIYDIEPLGYLSELEVLYLDSNHVRNIDPLFRLENLVELYLDYNPLSDRTVDNLRSHLPYCDIMFSSNGMSHMINMDALSLIGSDNGTLLMYNGHEGYSGFLGDRPYVSYFQMAVSLPLGFYLYVEDHLMDDALSYGDWNTNLWPDRAEITGILLWDQAIYHVFLTGGEVLTYHLLNEILELHTDLYYVSVYDQWSNHDRDVYTAEYRFDRYGFFVTFFVNDYYEYEVLEMNIWEEYYNY
jgi:hypothetical protein